MMEWVLAILVAALPPGAIQVHSSELAWRDAGGNLPAGTKIAILEGNPQSAGMFTIRLQVPAGASLPRHTHPRDERVTVLSGAVAVDLGAPHARATFGAGDFYINPADTPHAVAFPAASVIQITSNGPWAVQLLD